MLCRIVDFFNRVFFQRLVASMVATIIGVFLGGWIALWVNRRSQRNAAQAEKRKIEEQMKQARIQTLQALRQAIGSNDGKVKALFETVTFATPKFNVDPLEIEFLIPESLRAGLDLELVHQINEYRYELSHLGRKIDAYFETWYGAASSTAAANRRGEMQKSIMKQIEKEEKTKDQKDLIQMANDLIKAIDEYIKKEGVN